MTSTYLRISSTERPDWFKIAFNVITGSLTDISQLHF